MRVDKINRKELEKAIAEITEVATSFGLDFYPMRYEICPAEVIYSFGAYGMPTRFSHWSFGKQFHKMKLQYDVGLSKIYELVINSNPCYAFLLDSNSLIQNKLIVAHVLAHCDFFKNNARFMNTNRDMVESMAATADRVREYEKEFGQNEVENFIDAVLSVEEHIDPSLIKVNEALEQDEIPEKKTPYDDIWDLDKTEKVEVKREVKFPEFPEKDIMLFIIKNSPSLEEWQRDIMTMIREEMLYFWPQLETKIMNEGWASFWHKRIIRELDLSTDEVVEFAKLNASVVQPSKTSINPYYLGIKIFEDIEKRYNNPDEKLLKAGVKKNSGLEKIFEVREIESDTSFIRNYLTKDLVKETGMYMFQKSGRDYKVLDSGWKDIRDEIISLRVNGGYPYITVNDGNYRNNNELLLVHEFEGVELDVKYLEKVLPYLFTLWGKTVHLKTILDGKAVAFSCDASKHVQKRYV